MSDFCSCISWPFGFLSFFFVYLHVNLYMYLHLFANWGWHFMHLIKLAIIMKDNAIINKLGCNHDAHLIPGIHKSLSVFKVLHVDYIRVFPDWASATKEQVHLMHISRQHCDATRPFKYSDCRASNETRFSLIFLLKSAFFEGGGRSMHFHGLSWAHSSRSHCHFQSTRTYTLSLHCRDCVCLLKAF